MCIVFLAFSNSPNLVIASNRDEFYDRPTLRAQIRPISCSKYAYAISGIDLERDDRGTWFGVSTNQNELKFAFVTNFKEDIPAQFRRDNKTCFTDYKSRGSLVTSFINSSQSTTEYITNLIASTSTTSYMGFNLIVGTVTCSPCMEFDVFFATNRGPLVAVQAYKLDSGMYGLSNTTLYNMNLGQLIHGSESKQHAVFDTYRSNRLKNKVQFGIFNFTAILAGSLDLHTIVSHLWDLLRDTSKHGLDEGTNVNDPLLSIHVPPFDLMNNGHLYGTRSSTLVLLSGNGDVTYLEKEYGTLLSPKPNSCFECSDLANTYHLIERKVSKHIDLLDNVIRWRFNILG